MINRRQIFEWNGLCRILLLLFCAAPSIASYEVPEGAPTQSWQRAFVTGLYDQVQSKVAAGTVSECRGMAEVMDGIADIAESPAQFSTFLGAFIAPKEVARWAGLYVMQDVTSDWNPARRGAFNSFQQASGFAAEYIKPRRPIQNHAGRFAAFFQMGFSSGGLPPEAFRIASLDDPEIPNMKMAMTANVVGAQLRNGVFRMRDVAIYVRQSLCSQEPQRVDLADKSARPASPPFSRTRGTFSTKGKHSLRRR